MSNSESNPSSNLSLGGHSTKALLIALVERFTDVSAIDSFWEPENGRFQLYVASKSMPIRYEAFSPISTLRRLVGVNQDRKEEAQRLKQKLHELKSLQTSLRSIQTSFEIKALELENDLVLATSGRGLLHLPDEVIRSIVEIAAFVPPCFKHSYAGNAKELKQLAHINTRIRSIIKSSSTTLYLGHRYIAPRRQPSSLNRFPPKPLPFFYPEIFPAAKIDLTISVENNSRFHTIHVSSFISRVHRLRIEFPREGSQVQYLERLIRDASRQDGQVKSLHLSRVGTPSFQNLMGTESFSTLTDFGLTLDDFTFALPQSCISTNLKAFFVIYSYNNPFHIKTILGFLSHHPSLKFLQLRHNEHVFFRKPLEDPPHLQSITLPSLVDLQVGGNVGGLDSLSQLTALLNMPILKHLHITLPSVLRTPFDIQELFSSACEMPLTSIHFKDNGNLTTLHHEPIIPLAISKFPNLKAIEIYRLGQLENDHQTRDNFLLNFRAEVGKSIGLDDDATQNFIEVSYRHFRSLELLFDTDDSLEDNGDQSYSVHARYDKSRHLRIPLILT